MSPLVNILLSIVIKIEKQLLSACGGGGIETPSKSLPQ